MALVEHSEELSESAERLFDLTQDYSVRRLWDPFPDGYRFIPPAHGPEVGALLEVRAKNGQSMIVRYVSYNRPRAAAIEMISGEPSLLVAQRELGIMDIDDYLIDQVGKDWTALLRDWMPPLPSSFTLWLVNRFGDAFVVANGSADNWLMIPLVDECRSAGMQLGPNQCFGFKIPPVLGGKYQLSNIEPTDLTVHYSFLAEIYKQTKDLPDGTPINAVVVE